MNKEIEWTTTNYVRIIDLLGTVCVFHTVRVRYIPYTYGMYRTRMVRFSVPYAYGCTVRVYLA